MAHAPTIESFLKNVLDVRSGSLASCGSSERNALALHKTLMAIADSVAEVGAALHEQEVEKSLRTNEFGDEVLSVDLVADARIRRQLEKCPAVASFASEEHPVLTTTSASGQFCVTFDPLDGSSIIDTNFAVGSIFAVWPGNTPIGLRCGEVVASAVAVYGPRTTLYVALGSADDENAERRGDHKAATQNPAHLSTRGVWEFVLHPELRHVEYDRLFTNAWRLVHRQPFELAAASKIFAPGNLRVARVLSGYRQVIDEALNRGMTLRYTGGMVPDVMQFLVKGNGTFLTPAADGYKIKLRVCFECAALAHMITLAGGYTTDLTVEFTACWNGKLRPYTDVVVEQIDQRSSVALGSRDTTRRWAEGVVGGKLEPPHEERSKSRL